MKVPLKFTTNDITDKIITSTPSLSQFLATVTAAAAAAAADGPTLRRLRRRTRKWLERCAAATRANQRPVRCPAAATSANQRPETVALAAKTRRAMTRRLRGGAAEGR